MLVMIPSLVFLIFMILGRLIFIEEKSLLDSIFPVLLAIKVQKELERVLLFAALMSLSFLWFKSRALSFIFSITTSAGLMFRGMDYGHYLFEGHHITLEVLQHITWASVRAFASVGRIITNSILVLVFFYVIYFLINRLNVKINSIKKPYKIFCAVAVIVFTFAVSKSLRIIYKGSFTVRTILNEF